MKTVRFVATVLFYLTRTLALLYFITAAYATAVLLFSTQDGTGWISIAEDNTFVIFYPFTTTPFLLGEMTTPFFTEMYVGIIAYGTFFWLLSDVFSAFRKEKIFTASSVRKLSRFYIANLTVPIVVLVLLSVLTNGENIMGMITALHFIIGIFAFFMASIFQQGVNLQDEQDLTI